MPRLDWSQEPIELLTGSHSSLETQLEIHLEREAARRFFQTVRDTCFAPGAALGSRELCVTLSQEWTLYFKSRESGTRMMLAHPEPKEWVATLAMDEPHLARLEESLASSLEGEESARLELSRLGRLTGINNFELVLVTRSA